MNRRSGSLALAVLVGAAGAGWAQDREAPRKKAPAGIYAVERDGAGEKDVQPLREGEVLVVNRHRYLKNDDNEPPRYVVVHAAPEVPLELAAEPRAEREGGEVVRIFLKLRPRAAEALARLTRDPRGKQLAIVLDGEVVTVHKVRSAIPDGEVQITSCAAGAAGYLLKQLQAHVQGK
jgi:preprotein translocase subunit SecD